MRPPKTLLVLAFLIGVSAPVGAQGVPEYLNTNHLIPPDSIGGTGLFVSHGLLHKRISNGPGGCEIQTVSVRWDFRTAIPDWVETAQDSAEQAYRFSSIRRDTMGMGFVDVTHNGRTLRYRRTRPSGYFEDCPIEQVPELEDPGYFDGSEPDE